MRTLITIAMLMALSGCIMIHDKGVTVVREREVNITATGFETLPPGNYRFFVERKDRPKEEHAWSCGVLTVTESRHYVYGEAAKQEDE